MLTSEITWKLEADNASLALLFLVWRKHDMLQSLLGTHVQCRSLKFQKTVSYLSEICQKTVSHTNLSENSQNCVRYLS